MPLATGSVTCTNTIGTVAVICRKGATARGVMAKIASGLRSRSSPAAPRMRSTSVPAQRYSIRNVAAFGPTQIVKPLDEGCDVLLPFRVVLGDGHQDTQSPHPVSLLRARGEGPRDRCAADKRHEIASLRSIELHSIPSEPGPLFTGAAASRTPGACERRLRRCSLKRPALASSPPPTSTAGLRGPSRPRDRAEQRGPRGEGAAAAGIVAQLLVDSFGPAKRVSSSRAGGNVGSAPMCDYSLQNVKTRPAKVGDKLTTREFNFRDPRLLLHRKTYNVAVCVLPGTELSFTDEVRARTCRGRGLKILSTTRPLFSVRSI